MGSTFAGIEIGKRSIMAQNQAINTAGHNISNQDVEGYTRQRVNISSMEPIYQPDLSRELTPGQIGQGSMVQSIERLRDELVDGQIVAQTNQEGYWSTREKYYVMLEQIYNEPADISVRTNMDKFWDSWQELSIYPESKAARQAVVTRGESLIESINQQYTGLGAIGTLLDGDIQGTTKQVNDLAKQIAGLNEQIVRSRAMGDNPNDLLDRRDLMTEKLSSLINVTVDQRDPDEYIVQTGGFTLVQGSAARSFAVVPQVENNGYGKVVWADTGYEAKFAGGSLGSLIELRDVDVRQEMQGINTMTMNFIDLVNDVHRNGVGANGKTNLDFFVERPYVNNVAGNVDTNGDGVEDSSFLFRMSGTNTLKPKEQIGLEGTVTISGKSGNIDVPYYPSDTVETVINRINNSDGEVKAYLDRNDRLVLKSPPSSDMQNPDFVIRHVEDSGHFLAGYAGLLQGSGAENAYDFAVADAASGLANGAQFSVSPTSNPSAYIQINPALKTDVLSIAAAIPANEGLLESGDGNAALAIASMRNSQVMIGNSRTFDDFFAEAVTNVGLKGEQAELNYKSQTTIMADLRILRESVSGVNIDEELSDIIKFQHGYNAAAKFISIVDELLDTVINRMGV